MICSEITEIYARAENFRKNWKIPDPRLNELRRVCRREKEPGAGKKRANFLRRGRPGDRQNTYNNFI